jgi:hypothetical protein
MKRIFPFLVSMSSLDFPSLGHFVTAHTSLVAELSIRTGNEEIRTIYPQYVYAHRPPKASCVSSGIFHQMCRYHALLAPSSVPVDSAMAANGVSKTRLVGKVRGRLRPKNSKINPMLACYWYAIMLAKPQVAGFGVILAGLPDLQAVAILTTYGDSGNSAEL